MLNPVKKVTVSIDVNLSLKAARMCGMLSLYAKKNRLRTSSLADALVYSLA